MILSPSPPPPQQVPTQSPAPGTPDTIPTNPQVASLKSIFPDFDEAVILSVLESTDNDHDRALDVLLGMNDPSFVPPERSQSPQSFPFSDAQHLSQEALDEQFARRLALEEEEAASRAWQPQTPQGQTTYQSYQPRRGTRWGGQAQSQPQLQGQSPGQGGRDTVAEFQEGFNRIAESGKKTFTSIVSKVKAKMQEFDQGQGWSGFGGSPSNVPPNQPSAPSQGPYYQPYEGAGQGAYAQPNSRRQTSQSLPVRGSSPTWTQSRANSQSFSVSSSPPRSGVIRSSSAVVSAESIGAQHSSYYDPNTQGYDLYGDEDEAPITLRDLTTPAAAPVDTQNTAPPLTESPSTPPPASDSASAHSAPPSYKSGPSSPQSRPSLTTSPSRSFSPIGTNTTASPPRTSANGSVDFSKLGLLPKRPISLVSPPTTGAAAPPMAPTHSETSTASTADEREEAEFVENPFEDR